MMITDRDLIGESRIQPHATEKTPGKSRAFERSRKSRKNVAYGNRATPRVQLGF